MGYEILIMITKQKEMVSFVSFVYISDDKFQCIGVDSQKDQ